MSILKDSIAVELARWNRTESPLVTAARSFRNENPSGTSSGAGNEGDQSGDPNGDGQGADDPFASIPLDDLPDDVRDTVVAARERFALLQTQNQQTTALAQQQAQLARQHQSRADQMFHKLKAHNLHQDGTTPVTPQENPMEVEIRDQFMREQGMDQKTATQWAKMMMTAAPVMQKHMVDNVTQTLSPLVQTVGSMQADRIFQQAQNGQADPYGLLQMPEIYDQVHQGLQLMVQNGQPVSVGAVQSLANMAYGELALSKPEVLAQYQQQQQTNQPVFGNNANIRGSSRGLPSPSGGAIRPRLNNQQQNNGAPVAQDAETGKAVAATVAAMLRGTNIKIKQ